MRSDSEATTPASSSGKPASDRLVLVTNGCSGLGLVCARRLASEHDLILVSSSRDPDPERGRDQQRQAIEELRSSGATGALMFEMADLSEPGSAQELRGRLKASGALDRLYAIVHVSESDEGAPFLQESRKSFEECMERHFFSAVNLSSEFVPDLVRNRRGRVIVIGSGAESRRRSSSAYAASMSALETLVRSLAGEVGASGVTVNGLRSGPVLASWVAFLLSDAASVINGNILTEQNSSFAFNPNPPNPNE